ncbi:3' terminal RNA ribose 2'-O-methyltransferase Hen1 [Allocatelliglobosispora scoriae]|uniref:3' terminal RNA ribose 2'-O-methyltransferase Hen1 n=1 Tax=Allocatelliglobosispora scoriae TaxID=643052 RepID=UPI00161B7118|nr:3' terminal RNA ribose 2'-O-methyltransferase Hen1 [Allocatelliglobosispora scoriae]
MLLTVSTTHDPATDLGYLLVKHPDRLHEVELPTGRALVCYPEATRQRCTAALILEVDPIKLQAAARGRTSTVPDGFTLSQHVNDRPYAASSLLASALTKTFRSAMKGASKDRPELAATAIPLEIRVPVLRCRGGADLAVRFFEPLGWQVTAEPIALDPAFPEWGESRYVDLRLAATMRLADALNHLYVLIPVLDDARHYWVSADDIDTLLRSGDGWLAGHPERRQIVHRYLAHQRQLSEPALERLAESDDLAGGDSLELIAESDEDGELPGSVARAPLARLRREAVVAAVVASGATRVLDLGCGPGALLSDLVKHRHLTEIVGVDISARSLATAARKLRLDRPHNPHTSRVRLVQGALTYRDSRLAGFDAAVLMEVIEHLDEPRLPALVSSVFGHAKPSTVIVTMPNVEHNVRYEGLAHGTHRHHDHRFEWTRAQFRTWADAVAAEHGYTVAISPVGDDDPEVGPPTQLAVFSVKEREAA